MKDWIVSIFSLLFSRKDNREGVYVESFEEKDTSNDPSDLQQPVIFLDVENTLEVADPNNYENDPYEEEYQNPITYDLFNQLVKGTRYEQYSGNTSSLWVLESLFSDSSAGKMSINAKYRLNLDFEAIDDDDEIAEDEYADSRRFNIDAYFINTLDFEVLKHVLDAAKEEVRDSDNFDQIRFSYKIFKNDYDIEFAECYHEHYSSYNSVKGNMYDDNMDTNGSSLRIMAVRCYLLYNTDTKEFVLADGRYWCC